MSDMVERVARAVFETWRTRMNDIGEHPNSKHTFEDLSGREHEFAMLAARTTIEAMRDPTEAMIKSSWADALAKDASAVWSSMIDEALK